MVRDTVLPITQPYQPAFTGRNVAQVNCKLAQHYKSIVGKNTGPAAICQTECEARLSAQACPVILGTDA